MTFALYSLNYANIRKQKHYADNKELFEAMPLSRKITKFSFTFGTIMVLVSFWIQTPWFFSFHNQLSLRIFGLILTFSAFLFLKKSLQNLGKNYSPLFDSHRPGQIVKTGPYRFIRHPVYLANMFILLGYVFSSGSMWVIISTLWGWGYMLRSIIKEDAFLSKEFPEYIEYKKQTWRIIPFVF
jgi:protein-S-isoprenylcysteine O-methyltransferase Ste14